MNKTIIIKYFNTSSAMENQTIRDSQHLYFTIDAMNSQPQARIGVISIPICKSTIRINIYARPEFQQGQSCIPTPIATNIRQTTLYSTPSYKLTKNQCSNNNYLHY